MASLSVEAERTFMCRVFIKDGIVVRAEEFVEWNGEPWNSLRIVRDPGESGFELMVYKPGQNCHLQGGKHLDILLRDRDVELPPEGQERYLALFRLTDATPDGIADVGLQGFTIQAI